MEFLYLGGFALLVGVGAGFAFATSARRGAVLIGGAAALAALLFGLAWATAPASPEEADYSCSDCGMWLGRWWEGWLTLFLLAVNFVAWTVGIAVGVAIRTAARTRQELRERRGAVAGRH